MLTIDELKFDSHGLIPAIVVDAASQKVLTLAYMNRESLDISLKEKRTCFWSRSRQADGGFFLLSACEQRGRIWWKRRCVV